MSKKKNKKEHSMDEIPLNEAARRLAEVRNIREEIQETDDELVSVTADKSGYAKRVRDCDKRVNELTGRRDGLVREMMLVMEGKQETLPFPPLSSNNGKKTGEGATGTIGPKNPGDPGEATGGAAYQRARLALVEEMDTRLKMAGFVLDQSGAIADEARDKWRYGLLSELLGKLVDPAEDHLEDAPPACNLGEAVKALDRLHELTDEQVKAAAEKGPHTPAPPDDFSPEDAPAPPLVTAAADMSNEALDAGATAEQPPAAELDEDLHAKRARAARVKKPKAAAKKVSKHTTKKKGGKR